MSTRSSPTCARRISPSTSLMTAPAT